MIKREQEQVIKIIARELNLISIQLFQQINLEEFYNKAWTRENKKVTSPNLLALTNHLNRVSNFVAYHILSDKNNSARYIEFFIHLANHLCHRRDEFAPDLLTASEIISALDLNYVTRLDSCYKRIPESSVQIHNELQKLFNRAENGKSINKSHAIFPDAIPVLSQLQKHILFIYDGNNSFQDMYFTLGKIFFDIGNRQKCLPRVSSFETDLLNHLSVMEFDEAKLEQMSSMIQPKKLAISSLSFSVIETELKTSLEAGLIPLLFISQAVYEGVQSIKPLAEALLKTIKEETKDEVDNVKLNVALSKARELMNLYVNAIEKQTKNSYPNLRTGCMTCLANITSTTKSEKDMSKKLTPS